jgi:O-antigen/teichoic acid export membrane protein
MTKHGETGSVAFKPKLLHHLARGSLGSIAVRVVGTVLSFAVVVLLARSLGPDGYGIYSFALSFIAILAIPAQVGLPELVVRETARAQAKAAWGLLRGLWRWSNMFVALFSVLMLILGLLVLYCQEEWPDEPRRQTLAVGFALIPLIALGNIRGAALRGLRKVVLGQLPEHIIRPFLLLLMLVLANGFWGSAPITPVTAMYLHGLSAFSAFVVGAVFLLRCRPPGLRSAPAPEYASRQWRLSALPLALLAGLQLINAHADILMLGLFRSDEEVGVYRVVVQVATLVVFGLMAINQVLDPYFARLHQQGDYQGLQRLVTYSSRTILVLAVPPVIIMVTAGGPLLAFFFGDEYRIGATALTILALGHLINAGMGSVGVLLKMTGHERDAVRGIAGAAVANVVLNLVLIPPFGGVGAATATAVTLLVWNVILRHFVRMRLGIESTVIGGVIK